MDWIRHRLTELGTFAAHPAAFLMDFVRARDVRLARPCNDIDLDDDAVHSAIRAS